MRRLLRGTFKLAVLGGIVAGLTAVARKLMGGFGPPPGSDDAPKEWPSLVPEPAEPTGTTEPTGDAAAEVEGAAADASLGASQAEALIESVATGGTAEVPPEAAAGTDDLAVTGTPAKEPAAADGSNSEGVPST